MKLRSLSLKGFRSFSDEAKIDFPENGLVLIRGKNVDATGVSSGSGKSSILLALAYALKYCPYDASQLQSWFGDEALEVKLEVDGASLVRGVKTSIEIEGQKISGVAAVDKKLFDHIGLSPGLLEALTYRPQQSRGLFLSKTNSEMQEFLSTLLELEKFEAAIEVCNTRCKDFDSQYTVALEQLRVNKDLLERARVFPIEILKDPQVAEDVLKDTEKENFKLLGLAETCQENYEAAKKRLSQDGAVFRTKRQGIEAKSPPPFDDSEIEQKEALAREARARLEAAKKQEREEASRISAQRSALERELAGYENEIKALPTKKKQLASMLESKCPTCSQQWVVEQHKLHFLDIEIQSIEQLATQIPGKKEEISRCVIASDPKIKLWEDAVAALGTEIAVLKTQKENFKREFVSREAARVSEAKARLLEEEQVATSKQQAIVDAYRNTLEEATRALATSTNQIGLYKQQISDAYLFNDRANKANERRLAEIVRLQEALDKATGEVSKANKNQKAEIDLIALLKGFMSSIFDEVLNEIAWNANQMLALIPNVSHVAIGFKSESVTNKGTVKRAIVPYLNIGGAERPVKAALSGGMLAAVELAVDLAVRKVISARTGVTPGWLVLDESFDGLGVTEKEAVMALLSHVAKDTLILVVDHSSEFKEFFSQIIEVEFSNGRSKIVGT